MNRKLHDFQIGDRVRITTQWGIKMNMRGTVTRVELRGGKLFEDSVKVRLDNVSKRRTRIYRWNSLKREHALEQLAGQAR